MVLIETSRLVIREFTESDWESVHEYAKNGEILIYQIWGPNTEEQTKTFVKEAIEHKLQKPRREFELGITVKPNNTIIGGCGFRIKPNNTKRADFGYTLNPKYWNKGYATEAALGLIDYMITHQGISEIEASSDSLNLASINVLGKCGLSLFKEVKNEHEIDGRMRDTYYFEKIISDS